MWAAGCKCNDSWSYTSPKTGQVYQMSGSAGCANPGGDRQLPWCKVDARNCAHVPRTESITSGDTFNFCTAPGSNTTLDTRALSDGPVQILATIWRTLQLVGHKPECTTWSLTGQHMSLTWQACTLLNDHHPAHAHIMSIEGRRAPRQVDWGFSE